MGGLRGNDALLALAKQTAKGTPNTTYTDALPFSGGSIAPSRTIDQLSETDSQRDQGVSFVQITGVEGDPEVYVRDASIHRLLNGVLGSTATTGTTNYTHTATPANTIPYFTFFREIGDTLYEQFNDCKISELTISADAGNPLTAAITLNGTQATRLAAEPASVTSLTLAAGTVYNFNDATVTLAGAATALVSSFELTISNNVTTQQTDDSVPYDVIEGLREVTLGFTLIFETLAEYNRFHYGSTSGTAQVATLGSTSADFLFTKGINNTIQFTLPNIAYQEFPVNPDPGGDPVTVDVTAVAQRGGSPVVTAITKNQIATI
jgi:Phage tail tube protein